MGHSYNIKLKKGDVEIEVFGPDKEFVSNKFTESILVAFDKPEVFKEAVNQLPVQVADKITQESANVEVQQVATVEDSQVVEAAPVQEAAEIALVEPVVEAPAQVAEPFAEVLEASQPVEVPVQEAAANTEIVQAVAQPAVQETIQEAEPIVEATVVVAPVESTAVLVPVVENAVQEVVQAPQLGKASLASIAQVSEEALSKVYTFKKDVFKANKGVDGTTALKQASMTKLVLLASEYLNGVNQLSGKALGKHMKAIGTGNLATNLKKDSGIVKDGNFYRLNDAGKQAAFTLIKSLAQS